MIRGDTMRVGSLYEGFDLAGVGLAAWLVVSAWLLAMPLTAALLFTMAGVVLLGLSGYNAFLRHQGLPASQLTGVVEQVVAVGVILVPAIQPVGVVAMGNAIVVGAILFALAGIDWTEPTPVKTPDERPA